MNSWWENEIAAKNMERTLSIVFQLQNSNDFEKSIVDKSISEERIEKSGLEIKEKLQTELSAIVANKEAFMAKMISLVKEIGQQPAGSLDRRLIKGFEDKISELPKQYGYDQIYSDEEISKSAEMRDFNQTATSYVKHCVEEVKLNTVLTDLPDDKMVLLSKALADELGF